MKVWIEDVHAQVYRLVPVVKMETVPEECTVEEQRSIVRFYGRKDSMQRLLIKKCFLYSMGSLCLLKRFTAGSRISLKDVQKSQMMPDYVALFILRQKQLCSGWKGSFEQTER
jgi:hypothetical protein